MDARQARKLVLVAVAGLTSGLAACGGATPPAESPAAGEPAGEKHACKAGSDKNGCGGHDAPEKTGDAHEHPTSEAPTHEKQE
jgi:hypothetical protein